MTSPNLSTTLAELNELCLFFKQAEANLLKGQIADMTGVDTRISAVCQSVAASMPEQQKEYLPILTTLIELLNGYEQSLRNLQKATEQGGQGGA